MLGYLDALITALSLRDATEGARLLEHPLARLLPADVCEEATAFVAGTRDALAVPLRTMQLRRQTAELLQEAPVLADAAERVDVEPLASLDSPGAPPDALADVLRDGPHAMVTGRRARRPRPHQMELPLSA
jgi:hypothetical protein